ncbi:MAG: LysR family transcriptional regulator [Sphingobium sp.]|nr:LysR family transcriptional regulator [Sphingobium sp.]
MNRLECDRAFLTVVEAGSFAGAAQILGISSGQASKLVQKLEQNLGVQLLRRTTRALSLTEIGMAYHARMKSLIEDIDELDTSVRTSSGTPRGRLRVTIPSSFGKLRLMPLLTDFARTYSEIELDIDFSDRSRDLIGEGFDLAVRVGRPEDSSLIARKLHESRNLLVATPAYLETREPLLQPKDLHHHACIVDTNFREPLNWRFREPDSGKTQVTVVAPVMRVSDGEACLTAIEAGLGVGIVPDFIAQSSLEEGRVIRLLSEWEDTTFSIYAIYPPARQLALKVRVLIDFLVSFFSSPATP